MLPSGRTLSDPEWNRHHSLVLRVLVALSVLVPVYSAMRGFPVAHVAGHLAPLILLNVAAASGALSRTGRAAAAALGLMTASALVVHASHGATEAHFMFFALLPLAAVYAAWTPFLLAVGYVAVHHFAVGSLAPTVVFDHDGPALPTAFLHAGFVLAESVACLVGWRLFEDRRELVEGLVIDRTAELREQRDVLARLAAVVESTDDAVITMTAETVIVTWNPGAERLYGYTSAEAVGQYITLLVAPETLSVFRSSYSALREGPSVHVESRHVRKDGSRLEASVSVSNIRDAAGNVTGSVAIARDISERKRAEAEARETARKLEGQAEELTRLALHDPLTGLANRSLLHDRLGHALAGRTMKRIAVLLLDIDDFKSVNDVSGHTVGDRLLVEVARRLERSVRPGDTVARLGGDEFVVLSEDIDDTRAACAVAERILTSLGDRVEIDDEQFFIDASVGIAVADEGESRGPIELLRDADIAMYAAKEAGKGRYQVFEPDMHHQVVTHTKLVRDLRGAVANRQLRLVYQPQVDLASGRMTGVEALVRWEHPEHGLITPDRFIPAAESTGMIVAIDDWVLREACTQVRAWDEAGLPPLDIAVNVSARRLIAGDLARTTAAVAQETALDLPRLEIEITETVAIDHEPEALDSIRDLRTLGVRVAIDDFGMGHSALSRLQTFPVNRLKIDRSFVTPLTDGGERGSIADAMIAMGQSLGLSVIAEGVETHEQLRALRTLGCPSAQGYLFSKPVPPADIERLARTETVLAPIDDDRDLLATPHAGTSSAQHERLIQNLLAELQRITGLETTYLTRIDLTKALQRITHARNTGAIDIPEGLEVDWSDTVCRRALAQGVTYTDDVPSTFPDSQAAADLGLQTYVSVPLLNRTGDIQGTLCGASTKRVPLGTTAVQVMEHFAALITQGDAAPPPVLPTVTDPRPPAVAASQA